MMNTTTNDSSRRDFFRDLSTLGLAGAGGSLFLAACGGSPDQWEAGQAPAQSASQERDVERLHQIRRAWEQAENEGDPSIIDRYATQDVVAMPPGRPPSVGAEAGKRLMQKLFEAFDMEVTYDSEEIVVNGDLAFDRGTASQKMVPKSGGEPTEGEYSYLWVYRRVPEEGWKQSRAIWNKNG